MLRSIFVIFISCGIVLGGMVRDEGSSRDDMRSINGNPFKSQARKSSELVQESRIQKIFQTSHSEGNAFVKWLNLRKSDTSHMEDYIQLTRKADSAVRKPYLENELYEKMAEDDFLESLQIAKEAENDLMSSIDVAHLSQLTFPFDVEDEYFCNAKESGIIFISYIRGQSTLFQLGNNEALKQSGYDVTKNTEILIHDWMQNIEMNFDQAVSAYAISNMSSSNLLFVDWSSYSRCEYVYTVNKTVPTVGMIVSKLVRQLVEVGADIKNLHLIGHGMGAQIASFAAKQYPDNKIARITGLDPAGPGYNLQPSSLRLDKTDADFVDIIHTDMEFYGTFRAVGHADFYPNGGDLQKGCADNHQCNHQRAMSYYLESLYIGTGFYGVECNKYINYKLGMCKKNKAALMGEFTPTSTRGKYYLDTFTFLPYSKGQPNVA